MRRDSGPAIAAGAAFGAKRDGNPVLVALAADHVVTDKAAFVAACREAAAAARGGPHRHLRRASPTGRRPNTAISRPGEKLGADVFAVDALRREAGRGQGRGLYRAGLSLEFRQFRFRREATCSTNIRAHDAATVAAARLAIDKAGSDLGFVTIDPEAFGEAKATSIDYAVMEKTKRAAVIPVSYGWSDVGSWHAVWELSPHDADGNSKQGNAVFVDTRNSFASSEKALVALFGVQDLVVVASEDAVLIADRKNTAEMKRLVQTLKQVAPAVTEDHIRVHRPWGNYQSLDNGDRYQVKRIVVKKGGRLSLQYHNHRAEHWIVVRGTARVTIGEQVTIAAREPVDLYPARLAASAGKSRQDRSGTDRGADRLLSRRGRHRPHRGRLPAVVTPVIPDAAASPVRSR